MFLRILFGLVVIALLLWVVAYLSGIAAVHRAQQEPWPYALGAMKEMTARHPSATSSPDAEQLMNLVWEMETDDAAFKYVAVQIAKGDDTIEPLPAALAAHEAELEQFVRLILGSADLRWGADVAGSENLGQVVDLVAAVALERARSGNSAAAWDYVHAMWILARSLKSGSWFEANVLPLMIERQANAVARKLPPPAPPWLAELTAAEPRRETAAVMQEDVLAINNETFGFIGPLRLLEYVFKPLRYYELASNIRHMRMTAEAMASSARCRIDIAKLDAAQADAPSDHTAEVYRASRFEAELEATAKVMALKAERARLGRWPPALADGGASRCAENRWIYDVKPDGSAMTLRMSWEVAAEPEVKSAPALQFAY